MRGFVICFVIYFEPYCVQISPFQPSFTDISVVVVTQTYQPILSPHQPIRETTTTQMSVKEG